MIFSFTPSYTLRQDLYYHSMCFLFNFILQKLLSLPLCVLLVYSYTIEKTFITPVCTLYYCREQIAKYRTFCDKKRKSTKTSFENVQIQFFKPGKKSECCFQRQQKFGLFKTICAFLGLTKLRRNYIAFFGITNKKSTPGVG